MRCSKAISFCIYFNKSITIYYIFSVSSESLKKLPERERIRYNDILQSSKTEPRYFVRIMIVGKQSAGKTCLLRRLLKEDIDNVSSTDGVDIVTRRCKINIENGEWTIDKGVYVYIKFKG